MGVLHVQLVVLVGSYDYIRHRMHYLVNLINSDIYIEIFHVGKA